MDIIIRKAELSDAPELSRLIAGLARFQKMTNSPSPESLCEMMSEPNGLSGIIAERNGKIVGMAVYSLYRLAIYSGKRVLYLEDIFVDESERGSGVGNMIFDELVKTAKSLDCLKIEWKCLEWNTNARKFYEKRGGFSDPEWLTYTLKI